MNIYDKRAINRYIDKQQNDKIEYKKKKIEKYIKQYLLERGYIKEEE